MEKIASQLPSFKLKRVLVSLLVVSVGLFLLTWKLSSLTSGFAPQEIIYIEQSSSLQSIVDNPINAPHKLVVLSVLKTGFNSVFALRLISVTFGFLFLLAFYFWIKSWTTRRMATLATILLICSSWFLGTTRISTPLILQPLFLSLIFWFTVFQSKPKNNHFKLIIGALILALSFYVPGMIWLLTIVLFVRIKSLAIKIKNWSLITSTFATIFVLLALTPLIFAFINNPNLISDYLGFPTITITPLQWLKNIVSLPVNIFFHTNQPAYLWLNSTPILDVFCAAMLLIGTYRLFYFIRSRRSVLVAGSIILLSIVISFSGLVRISILMPLIYFIVAYGMVLMLQQWFTVFPKNPFARTLGATIITIGVIIASFYGSYKYFVAWPNSLNTKNAFSSRQNY